MGLCVSKQEGSRQELDSFGDRDESSQSDDQASDSASNWSSLISDPFCLSNRSRSKVDASLLAFVTDELKPKHRTKAEGFHLPKGSIRSSSHWQQAVDSPRLLLRQIDNRLADKSKLRSHARITDSSDRRGYGSVVLHPVAGHVDASRGRFLLQNYGVDLESGELSIFAAESYFKESEPSASAALRARGSCPSLYLSDSDRDRDSSLMSECCTFSISDSVHMLSANNLNSILASKPSVYHPSEKECSDLDIYRQNSDQSTKLNWNDLVEDAATSSSFLNKVKGVNGELSVRISSKAPLSSVYWQMRHPKGRGYTSYGDDRSSVSSFELQSASPAPSDNFYGTGSETTTENQEQNFLSLEDSVSFHRLDHSKAAINGILCPHRSISFRRIFAPSPLSAIPYFNDAQVRHHHIHEAPAKAKGISLH